MKSRKFENGLDLKEAISLLSKLPYKKGEYASRYWGHKFHFFISYPSKLKPSIAHFLVSLFTRRHETILDPFSGVGTIPFEACAQTRIGIGSDISPIAYHATLAKIDPPKAKELHEHMVLLANYIKEKKSEVSIDEAEDEIVEFYHPDTLREILAARSFFLGHSHLNISFLMTCMLHILHGNRPYALSRRSHNIMPWPPKGEFVYKPVVQYLEDKVRRMTLTELPVGFIKGRSMQDNASDLRLQDASVHSIITSPPFYSNRDFLRMNRIRLWFCGWSYEKQESMKSIFLEHRRDLTAYEPVFKEFFRVLKPGRLCIMHLGVVKEFDMASNLVPYAEKAGFSHVATIYEDTSMLESHGIRDRGATRQHQFLILTTKDG